MRTEQIWSLCGACAVFLQMLALASLPYPVSGPASDLWHTLSACALGLLMAPTWVLPGAPAWEVATRTVLGLAVAATVVTGVAYGLSAITMLRDRHTHLRSLTF